MTLRMLDSIEAANLPYGADAYSSYLNGNWPDYDAVKAKFPGKHVVSLTVFPGFVAEGCDCESGDLTIEQAAEWAQWRLAAGQHRPLIYAGAANMQAVIAALGSLGVARSKVRLQSAHYGAGKHICGPGTCGYPQADGTQWRDNAPGLNGSLVDESLLPDDFFARPPKPKPRPRRHHASNPGDTTMELLSGAGAVTPIPVPTAVLLNDGMVQIGLPAMIRFTSNAPASLKVMLGDTGTWVPVQVDFSRSPAQVPLNGAAAVKVERVDGGDNLVIADFA